MRLRENFKDRGFNSVRSPLRGALSLIMGYAKRQWRHVCAHKKARLATNTKRVIDHFPAVRKMVRAVIRGFSKQKLPHQSAHRHHIKALLPHRTQDYIQQMQPFHLPLTEKTLTCHGRRNHTAEDGAQVYVSFLECPPYFPAEIEK